MAGEATIGGVAGGKEQAPSHSFAGAFEGALRTVRRTAMRMVDADPESVEARLWAGEITCLDCGAGLRPWGHARPRTLRDHGEAVEIQPRRSICRQCSERLGRFTTHVLLPTLALLRRPTSSR